MVLAPRASARGAFLWNSEKMTSSKKITTCLIIILILVLAEGGLLIAAGVGNEELVSQLRSDIDLILGATGAVVTALVATIGILWRALRSSQREFIETLKKIHEDK